MIEGHGGSKLTSQEPGSREKGREGARKEGGTGTASALYMHKPRGCFLHLGCAS